MSAMALNRAAAVRVVAEIGNNHEGNVNVARELIQRAADCGVDAVKFQLFRTESYVSKSDTARFARLKQFELSPAAINDLAQLARQLGLGFVSTAFDLGSVEVLEDLVDAYKVASGDVDFFPLLSRIGATGKPVILSSGCSDIDRVRRGIDCLRETWARYGHQGELAVLHCVSCYPVDLAAANLSAIATLADALDVPVGYSDHTIGLEASVIAVAVGARIIEKHFTLNKQYSDFRDHQLSSDPPEMTELVARIRQTTAMLGTGVKQLQPCETDTARAIQRSIVAAHDLPAGRCLELSDLSWVRPGGGLAPGTEAVLIGRLLRRALRDGERLELADLS